MHPWSPGMKLADMITFVIILLPASLLVAPWTTALAGAPEASGDRCSLDGCQALMAMREELSMAMRDDSMPSEGRGPEESDVDWSRGIPSSAPTPSGGRGPRDELGPWEVFSTVYNSKKQVGLLMEMLSGLERRVRSLEQPMWILRTHAPESPRMLLPPDPREWTRCTEGPCRCRPETRTLSCWRQGLEELPPTQTVPTDTKIIDLGANHITTLHRNSFLGLGYLTELDLFDNRLDYLPPNIFESLESVVHIRVHRNNLKELSEKMFLHQLNLATLDLSSNSIHTIGPKLFHPLRRTLVFLSLVRNRIQEIPDDALSGFEKLEEVDISWNSLFSLPVLKGLPSLRRLRLHRNKLKELPSDLFQEVPSLEVLTLRANRLTAIAPGLFAGLSKLRHLELSSNWITSIDSSDFADLVSLKELHLSQNFLESLPSNAFSSPTSYSSLERLFLFSNNLAVLEPTALHGLNNLSTIMLNNNLLRSIGSSTFESTPNLRKLQLDSNKFHFLPSRLLDPLTKLVSIKLAKNPWHCDCSILYLATWLRENKRKVWDSPATCRGPGDLGGQRVEDMTFDDLCEGQWASLVSLQPRVPVSTKNIIKQAISDEDVTGE